MTVKQNFLISKRLNWSIRLQAIILLTICLSCLIYPTAGNTDGLDKATLKALYTYKFGKFSKWPKEKVNLSTKKFEYCILGSSPFSQTTMNMMMGKTVQGLPLTIKVFGSGLIPEEVLSACHILFIGQSEKYRLSILFSRLKNLAVLTVSDIRNFSYQGGMITLIEDEGKIRFQINPISLQQAGISMSSKIMELAEIIEDGQQL